MYYASDNVNLNELYVVNFFRTKLGFLKNRTKFGKEIKKYIDKKFPGDKNKKLRKVLKNSIWEMFEAQRDRQTNSFERRIEEKTDSTKNNNDVVLMNCMAKMDMNVETYSKRMIDNTKRKIDYISNTIKK